MEMKTNGMFTLLVVSTSVFMLTFLESCGFSTLLRKQKQSRLAKF
jgi:hypothetical protein